MRRCRADTVDPGLVSTSKGGQGHCFGAAALFSMQGKQEIAVSRSAWCKPQSIDDGYLGCDGKEGGGDNGAVRMPTMSLWFPERGKMCCSSAESQTCERAECDYQ